MVEFRNYKAEDYQAVCDFLIDINKTDKKYINWNWARFEWMYEHPEFDKSLKESIGLWWGNGQIVGAAIYDMYYGEAFCAVLPEYQELYEQVLSYAYENLKDESGLGVAILDEDLESIQLAKKLGFQKAEQEETIMSCSLDQKRDYCLEKGLHFSELDPATNAYEFSWLLWQGFDHGTDKSEFEKKDSRIIQNRPHLKKELSLAVQNEQGENVAYTCLWFDEKTDYAYIEPVCTIPAYRRKGITKALLFEVFNRAGAMGAKTAYVISDMDFYKKIGLHTDKHYSFYWKE